MITVKCAVLSQHNATDLKLRERVIGMLTAGMSTRAICREFNINFSTISSLQRRFRQYGSTSNRPHNRRPRVTTSAQDLHIRAPEAHCLAIHPGALPSCFSTIMHCPMSQGSVHNSWKLKMSQFSHGLHTHQTGQPLSMLGMLWIDVYDHLFQFLSISSNFAQPLKRSETTFHSPQSTA